MIILLDKPATEDDIKNASEEYTDYIKITIDVENERVAIGGQYHTDAEKELLKSGSRQENIWGGGLDLITKSFETNAMVNIRPLSNANPEILNEKARALFLSIAKKFLTNYGS